jgi:hypothetical protein
LLHGCTAGNAEVPVVAAPPPPGTAGHWSEFESGIWLFHDSEGVQRGFILIGKHAPEFKQ